MYWKKFEGGYYVKKYFIDKEFCKIKKISLSEFNVVKDLVKYIWDKNVVGIGVDVCNIFINFILVIDVKRIENV